MSQAATQESSTDTISAAYSLPALGVIALLVQGVVLEADYADAYRPGAPRYGPGRTSRLLNDPG
jgi:hypothetical protein